MKALEKQGKEKVEDRLLYRFEVRRRRFLRRFSIYDSGICIFGMGPMHGGGQVMEGESESSKIRYIARLASAKQIWELRMNGLTGLADKVHKAYKECHADES